MMTMSNIVQKHFPLSILLILLSWFLTVCLAKTGNITSDELALFALKARITELPTHHVLAENWTTTGGSSSVCDWVGVTCGSRHLRVTALNISGMNLAGTIPPQLGNLSFLVSLDARKNSFTGGLPNEFGGFRRLKLLDLGSNSFSGELPPWIGSFQGLEFLSLWNNSFTGVIPPSIFNLSKLTRLSLSYNNLQGNLPMEIFNMSSLERIDMAGNGFSAGTLPHDMCRHLPRLNYLGFNNMRLVGQIPSSIAQCLQLQRLFLYSNSLTGEIPKEIANLKGLDVLSLRRNSLEGSIPKEIGNMSKLQWLYVDDNNLTGVIPEEIGKLSNLKEILFGGNKLAGSIPADIFNISTLKQMDFGGNKLLGDLPSTMCYNLPNLKVFYIGVNSIGGLIPNSISNCSQLLKVDFADNNFRGYIPDSFGDLSLLQRLFLHDNNLISDPSTHVLKFITSLVSCKYLKEINVQDNPLNGLLPDSVGNLSSSLEMLSASNCQIKGIIPSGIGNLSNLNTFLLHDNQLIGSLPDSIKRLQNLQVALLQRNKMSISLQLFCANRELGYLMVQRNLIIGGSIPDCFENITSMRYLHLGSSGLHSSIPASFWNLKDILMLDLSSNSLAGTLPPELGNLKVATLLNFSSNNFTGGIPSTIGDLMSLQNLSLSHNQLQGPIPEIIGKMLSLEQLDLSYNSLSGSLPLSFENLLGLTSFNVSFNNLSGEIPSRGLFANLTAESFISSGALCGPPRFHVLPCPNLSSHHRKRIIFMHKIVIVLVLMISTSSITCLGLIYLKYRRKAKSENIDQEGSVLVAHERISYYQLLRATEGYSQNNLLGTGNFGSVYKGTLEDGRVVAVKSFKSQLEGSIISFNRECEVLRNLRHRNLTKVISSCVNLDFKALVLEYMPNGSLDIWLHSNKHFLNLKQRLDILIDVACALQYLHCGYLNLVVHCDLKPSNVLLDEEMVAHVSDFGIAKLLGQEDSITHTQTLATLGYIAPEYALDGLVSTRCDVYSFGIMMMEVFTGKSPSDEMFGANLSLRSWVHESMPDRLANVIDVDLLSTFNDHCPEILSSIVSIMDVAQTCTNNFPRERSNVEEVLARLNKIKLQLQPYINGFGGDLDKSN
ncbi:OLC1v1017760C2 [Oldenlandia corymbosa var. corymbosa]|uniref:non-specific serine/threonine protein kinase n=1 Tax=Oldenlandia corymbosa var. corymbosa TaxID=529605 RepID=A0AAV1EA51_OLDCO|nr:OLC1v1017760C2 [Oldenlandia corymbosa var. corymbosa]